jgi:hypothetical protein
MPCEGHRRKSCRRNRVKPARGLIVGMPWFGVCAPSYGRRGRASRQRPEILRQICRLFASRLQAANESLHMLRSERAS